MLIGLIFMIKVMREEAPTKKSVLRFDRFPTFSKRSLLYGINFDEDKRGFIGFISKTSKNAEKEKDKDK